MQHQSTKSPLPVDLIVVGNRTSTIESTLHNTTVASLFKKEQYFTRGHPKLALYRLIASTVPDL